MTGPNDATKKLLLLAASCLLAPAVAGAQTDDELRAKELIATIQKEMAEIDRLLLEADRASPARARDKLEDAVKNIEELLRQVQENQASCVRNIEELVRLTKYQKSNQPGQGGGQSGEQPPPRNRERERDADPEQLKNQGQPEGARPEPKGDDRPEHGGPDHSPPEQRADGRERPPSERGQFEREDTAGRWGFLPPKVAEVFNAMREDQFPEKYRRLMEKYYQRENTRESKNRDR